MKIELPEELLKHLGSSMAMDVHWVDLKLTDGRKIEKVIIRGSRWISGVDDGKNGVKEFKLRREEILGLRRSGFGLFKKFHTLKNKTEPADRGNG